MQAGVAAPALASLRAAGRRQSAPAARAAAAVRS
jgi:hypothetical protein